MYISNLVISKAIVISANNFNEGYKRLDNLSFYLMAIITSFSDYFKQIIRHSFVAAFQFRYYYFYYENFLKKHCMIKAEKQNVKR